MASSLSVERASIILKHLSRSEEPMGVRELSRELGFSPSVVQKIINALQTHEFVAQDEQTQRYTLGPTALQIGLALLMRLEVREVARPYLESLVRATGETALLGIRDRDEVFYIDKVLPDAEVRMDAPLGISRPYHCTAVGKIILAHSDPDEFERLAAEDSFAAFTDNTITDPGQLANELERIREQGYALDRAEFKPGAGCVAAPLYNHDGQVAAAIAIAGPAERMQANLDAIIKQVLTTTQEVSTQLGYRVRAKAPAI